MFAIPFCLTLLKGTKRSDVMLQVVTFHAKENCISLTFPLQTDTQTLPTAPWCAVDTKLGCIRLTLKPSSAFTAQVLLDDLNRFSSTYPPQPPRTLSHMLKDGGEGEGEAGVRRHDAIAALRDTTFRVKRSSGVIEGYAKPFR